MILIGMGKGEGTESLGVVVVNPPRHKGDIVMFVGEGETCM